MRELRGLLAALFLIGIGGNAAADQTDPRLDALFEELRAAPDPAAAAPIEQEIWSIWLEVDDATANVLMQGGIVAMQNRNFAAALAQFDKLVEIEPDYSEAWNRRATAHYLAGHHEQSLSDIEHTLELEPRHFGALSGRGLVQIQMDDLPAALDSFEEALAVHPHLRGAGANAEALKKILDQRDI